MNSSSKRISDMLARVLIFAANHPELFAKDSLAGRLLKELAAAVEALASNNQSQTEGREDGKILTARGAKVRETLYFQLDTLSATAQSFGLEHFFAPRHRTDPALLEVARILSDRAEASADILAQGNLGPEFLAELKANIQTLENTIATRNSTMESKRRATSGIEHARDNALVLVERLDPLVENLLRKDEPTLASWRGARHVERYTRPQRRKTSATSTAPAGDPASDSHAA